MTLKTYSIPVGELNIEGLYDYFNEGLEIVIEENYPEEAIQSIRDTLCALEQAMEDQYGDNK